MVDNLHIFLHNSSGHVPWQEAKKMFGRLKESVTHRVRWYILRFKHREKRCPAESFDSQAMHALMALPPDFEQALKCHKWRKTALTLKLQLPALSEEELQRDLDALEDTEDRIELTKAEIPKRYNRQVQFIRSLIDEPS